ncbi:hypothetical protein D9613_012916 [Agrocybe pediades]|uniref:Uncharacterized protein n=1 Tax=Agrocybe pediades TaxID=84607 RepID=A0A8H4QES6_9AGAR|nr:hypothetical protein D9613_012916 [Agrocybe pediades]
MISPFANIDENSIERGIRGAEHWSAEAHSLGPSHKRIISFNAGYFPIDSWITSDGSLATVFDPFWTFSGTIQTRGDGQFTQLTTVDGDGKTASPTASTTLIRGHARAPGLRLAFESEVVNRQAWDGRKSSSCRKLLGTIKDGLSQHPLYLHIGHISFTVGDSPVSTKFNNVRAYGLEGRVALSLSARNVLVNAQRA